MARNKMPDVMVLLPGIMGSVLKKDGNVVWGYNAASIAKALFTLGGSMRRALALPHDDPAVDDLGDGVVADALMSDLHLLPGIWKIDGYTKIAAAIKANFEVTEGKNFFPFSYDWRRDNRVAARQLARAAHTWLGDWRQASGNAEAKLILIGHSMGGLVSRYFLECLEGWKDTKALVTFGTPYRGSLNALDGLANGVKKGPLELSDLARELTAMYQLLPVFECYDAGDGKLVRVGETSKIPHVDAIKAEAALAFHREIQAAVASNQNLPQYQGNRYRIFPVVGIEQQTNLTGRLDGEKVIMLQTYKGRELGGDGTVPRVSAIPLEMSDNPAAMYAATQHGSLQNADAVIKDLIGALTGLDIDLGSFRALKIKKLEIQNPVALKIEDVYFAKEPITVRARPKFSERIGEMRALLWRSGDDQLRAQATLREAGGGWHQAEFAPPGAGAYRVTVTGPEVETAEDAFVVAELAGAPVESEKHVFDLGTMRGGDLSFGGGITRGERGGPRSAVPPAEIEVTLSAETRAEIPVDGIEVVAFRVELAAEAVPLAVSQQALAKPDMPIMVSLSVENDALEIVGDTQFKIDPPASGEPRNGFFRVKGKRVGEVRLAVAFRQGGSVLGIISLAMTVVSGTARALPAQGAAIAAPGDVADDDKLALLVEQRTENGRVFYEFILHSEALGLPYRRLRSDPLLDRGGGAAATTQAFVERIYERVTQELKSWNDLKKLQREAHALGVMLCQELFEPKVAKELWPLRDRIKLVQVVSWEPYIPWELVILEDPDSGDKDERFLAEYGLVRTLSDIMPPRALPLAKWFYLGATFPMGTYPSIGAELDYFTGTSPKSLQGHGITSSAVPSGLDAFYDFLAAGDFDVLHIACHGKSEHQSIEQAELVLGDEIPPGSSTVQLVEVDTITVQAQARLKQRRPLVFLNACETGREGAVLTAWGGWPNVFLRAGAGVFVGTSWPVRDKPAADFSIAFYNALLGGKTLAEAADAGRAAAKETGDASWLAFKVYGHPRARREAT
jgi:hypothetical protein